MTSIFRGSATTGNPDPVAASTQAGAPARASARTLALAPARTAGRLLVLAGLSLLLCGCGSVPRPHWFRGHAPPPPEVSTALTVTAAPGTRAAVPPQFWQRNDVVLDLTGVAGSGSFVVQPRAGLDWPVRLALRVRPGSVGEIEVRGEQRWVVPVAATASGSAGAGAAGLSAGARRTSVDLELPPGVYSRSTAQIRVSWGPAE